jgi:hypothetical protein
MPNRDVHRPVGAISGTGFAYYHARNFPVEHALAEAMGGAAGGWLGAALPDWIDPATSPNHRHVGHGWANVVGAVWFSADAILDLQQRLRNRADTIHTERYYLTNDFQRLLSMIAEFLLRFLAGLLNGITTGYISHLLLDALTARGIPTFARGY